MIPLKLISSGKALPSLALSSDAIDKMHHFPPGFTYRKSGIHLRHFAQDSESQSELAALAVRDALDNAALPLSGIDLLISACAVQEQSLPSTACAIAAALGLPPGIPAIDINASCLSFLAALQVAAGLLNVGSYKRIAVVSSDLASRGVDWNAPEASLIFGDGAAAVILETGHATQGLLALKLKTYAHGRSLCEIRAGGTRRNPRIGDEAQDYLFQMDGKAMFRLANQLMPDFLANLLKQANIDLASVDAVIPHQASHLGMSHLIRKLNLPREKVVDIYAHHGNQVAASMPTALHEAYLSGMAGTGKRLLFLGTAAGFMIGGAVLDL